MSIRTTLLALLLLSASAIAAGDRTPKIDGVLGDGEWSGAKRYELTGGGAVLLLHRPGVAYVAVQGSKRGLASLCIGDSNHVTILHSSAALGTAAYTLRGGRWHRESDLAYAVRDARTGPPSEASKAEFLAMNGWLSNPSFAGSSVRDFEIRLTPARRRLAVTFLSTESEAPQISRWPAAVHDDCATTRLAQGWAEEWQTFDPATWQSIVE
jgi:hypothetical protein